MQTLFAISVLCFLGILCAALALARHVQASQGSILSLLPNQPDIRPDFKQHLLTAVEASTQTLRSSSGVATIPIQVEQRFRDVTLNQSVQDIAARKLWILPPHPASTMRLPLKRIGRGRESDILHQASPLRKPPQPASRNGVVQRLDPAYFNKDLGDLTDPYQPPRIVVPGRTRRN